MTEGKAKTQTEEDLGSDWLMKPNFRAGNILMEF